MGASSELHIQMQDELFNTVRRVDDGELGYLEGLLELREHRAEIEKTLEIIKEFESDKIMDIENEASKYPNGFRGHEVRVTPGRKTFSFKGIKEVEDAEAAKKEAEGKYIGAFNGVQKGIVQTTKLNENDPDSPIGWVDSDGEVRPFPSLSIGKSFVTVKQIKSKK